MGQAGFKPQRSIALAFGIDEEHGGIIVRTGVQFNLHVSDYCTIRAAPTSGTTSSPHTERMVSRSSLTKEVGPPCYRYLHAAALNKLLIASGFLEGRDDGVTTTPAVAEKGHFDLRMAVSSPG